MNLVGTKRGRTIGHERTISDVFERQWTINEPCGYGYGWTLKDMDGRTQTDTKSKWKHLGLFWKRSEPVGNKQSQIQINGIKRHKYAHTDVYRIVWDRLDTNENK